VRAGGESQASAPDQHFGKASRLLKPGDFSRVFDAAEARASHPSVLLLARRNDQPRHRLGLVVAKKNVRMAVQRNRFKRVVRESFRQQAVSEPFFDVVVLARRGAGELDNGRLFAILHEQWRKLARRTAASARAQHSNRES
jgi:ribonuclease P protein component